MPRSAQGWCRDTACISLVLAAGLALGPASPSATPESPSRLAERVLAGLEIRRPDVAACLAEEIAQLPARRDEMERLDDVLSWIDTAIARLRRSGVAADRTLAKSRSDVFVDIVETFNHERRLDAPRLAAVSDGRLTPRHVTAYARVKRALGSGHDPRKVLCGE